MKFVFSALILSSLLLCTNCKKEASVNPDQISNTPQLKKEPTTDKVVEERPKDSINGKNVVEFLSIYGKENRENQVLIKTRLGNMWMC